MILAWASPFKININYALLKRWIIVFLLLSRLICRFSVGMNWFPKIKWLMFENIILVGPTEDS